MLKRIQRSRFAGAFLAALASVILFSAASVALAALTFSGTNISGDSGVVLDTSGMISIGTSTATGVTIGRNGSTVSIMGSLGIGTTSPSGTLNIVGNPLIQNNTGPSFAEFQNTLAQGHTKVAVGMLGHPEANLSFNMNYADNVHRYYDPNYNAMWLALGSTGWALQFAPTSTVTSTDDWYGTGGKYLLYGFPDGRLIIGSSTVSSTAANTYSAMLTVPRGTSTPSIAGETDLVLDGNETVGVPGAVYLNRYNTGTVTLALGGGDVGIGTSTPQASLSVMASSGTDPLDVASSSGSSLFHVTGAGKAGINTAAPLSTLDVTRTLTNSTLHNLYSYPYQTITSTASYGETGLYSDVTGLTISNGVTDSGYVMGVKSNAFRSLAADAGTLANEYGFIGQYGIGVGVSSSAVTSAAYGLLLQPEHGAGTISTDYGVYIASAVTGGTVGSYYGIYQADTAATNYFGGKVGVGTTTPATDLQVTDANGSSTIRIGQASQRSCFEMTAASGTVGALVYIYYDSNAVQYATTTKPSFCQ